MAVVGTTPDYVVKVCENCGEDVLFLLDPKFGTDPLLEGIDGSRLLFLPLEHTAEACAALQMHLSMENVSLEGIACFDCESLLQAGRLALLLRLPFPSLKGIANTRNKAALRTILRRKGLCMLEGTVAADLQETLDFFRRTNGSVVLKPLCASGSELVFHCRTECEIKVAVAVLTGQLRKRRGNPLFRLAPECDAGALDPCRCWLVEQFVSGPEFSCDFVLRAGAVTLIRETGKVKAEGQSFGSVLAYVMPPEYPDGFSRPTLCEVLRDAAAALGFERGYFMVDFIVRDGIPVIIEMTPRPGGDAIPDLVKMATGTDILCTYLDTVRNGFSPPRGVEQPCRALASVNIFADGAGIITRLDPARVAARPWAKRLFLKKNVGDRVTLPPDDFDNRLLGYCIVSPDPELGPISNYEAIRNLLEISIAA